ncbi:MAG: autoinducer binding domain-containing protein [Rhodobacteraceae bacterium]|uniref:helix-turn-helix transcriptional regulator n=1 Tax=Amaricoccus sp. B4 TaxID=3368557 RepID=UPI001D3BD558|nr:autoinducer binding domain-containing protein [Paracoccaceae bacterium]
MDLRDYQGEVERAPDLWKLWDICTRYIKARRIARLYYAHLPPLGAPDADRLRFATEGFGEDVVQTYFCSGYYRTNRNLRYALMHPRPFYWDEVPLVLDGPLDPEQIALLRDDDPASGLCISVYGPNGRNGFVSLEFEPGTTRMEPGALHEMQWACQLAHLRYCALWVPALGPRPSLSRREQEVLIWVARGKSNPSIAEILGISAHTVDAHLRRIYLKLGVFDRITAAVRGIGVGIIRSDS